MLEFPALLASAEKGDRQEGEGRLLSFSTPTLGQFMCMCEGQEHQAVTGHKSASVEGGAG